MKIQNSIPFALLVATSLFTHPTSAAKAPPPPLPQPSSGTVVLDYDYAGPGSGAALFGLAVAPSGMIYSSGNGYVSDDWHGIVLASNDSGSTWWKILDDASPEWYSEFSGITSDAFGNVYVAGMLSDVNAVGSDRWIVRRSTDGGVSWTTADDFAMGSVWANPAGPAAITTDAVGNVYVGGYSVIAGQRVWTIRRGVGGSHWRLVQHGRGIGPKRNCPTQCRWQRRYQLQSDSRQLRVL
jgi:hypothetical protein